MRMRRTAGQDDVAVEVLADVHIALHDGVEGGLVDAGRLHAHHAGREQHLRAAEALAANGDHLHAGCRVTRFGVHACMLCMTAAWPLVQHIAICNSQLQTQ